MAQAQRGQGRGILNPEIEPPLTAGLPNSPDESNPSATNYCMSKGKYLCVRWMWITFGGFVRIIQYTTLS